ncbi:hypothetical protein ACLBYD_28200 [Rhodococcus sp. C26F]
MYRHYVGEVVTEVGSGVDEAPPTMRRVMSGPSANMIIVDHRDRPAGSAAEDPTATLLAQDRPYGRRGAHTRAMRAVTATAPEVV